MKAEENMPQGTEPTFESAMERLGEIAEKLESGKAPLDESMKYYEEGIRLVAFCRGKIAQARKRVVELGSDGEEESNGD